MGRYIVKLRDIYFEFSSIVDSPVTHGMKKEEFLKYYQQEYGNSGMNELPKRLERVEKKGTSCIVGTVPDELLAFNRAGENETCLSIKDIYLQLTATQQLHESDTPSATVGEGENANDVEGQK